MQIATLSTQTLSRKREVAAISTTVTRRTYTHEVAERIARANANKMEVQGYNWKRTGESGDVFLVTKPETDTEPETTYTVTLSNGGHDGADTELQSCTCPFCENGFNQHTCKHCVWLFGQLEREALNEREAAFTEWEEWGKPMAEAGKF